MQLPPSDIPAAALVISLGGDLTGGQLTVVGLGLSVACVGLVGISFLRRRPKKEEPPDDPKPVEKEAEPMAVPARDADMDALLSQIRYPLTDRERLVRALGGEDAEVEIGISRALPAGEVADRCFSIAQRFTSKGQVLDALDKASWITSVMSSVNMVPFPLRSPSDVPKRLARGYIEGVRVKDLLDRLRFPIENAADLLSDLSDARFGRPSPAHGDERQKPSPSEQDEPLGEGGEESEALLTQAHVAAGESDIPEEIPG